MWTALEHRVHQDLKDKELYTGQKYEEKLFLIAVSGGLDSVCLAHIFYQLQLSSRCHILHFHHGDNENQEYRNQAFEFTKKLAHQWGMTFHWEKCTKNIHSEAELRQERHQFFQQFMSEQTLLLTGHHLNDVFENRLIRMIRGTGVQGLTSFLKWDLGVGRPLLDVSRKELEKYSAERNINWVDDPTNQENSYLRNWIRNEWLVNLQKQCPGGVEQLAKSLDLLIQENGTQDHLEDTFEVINLKEVRISRALFLSLSTKDQRSVIAKVLRHLRKNDYTRGQIEEILKRLDKNQKEHTFDILSMNWVINAQQIMVQFNS